MAMNGDDVLRIMKAMRSQKAETYKYWQTSRKRIRESERAMTLAHYHREIEALDRVITVLLNHYAESKRVLIGGDHA